MLFGDGRKECVDLDGSLKEKFAKVQVAVFATSQKLLGVSRLVVGPKWESDDADGRRDSLAFQEDEDGEYM